MILGIGTDLVTIDRISSIVAGRTSDRFIRRILTEKERELTSGMNHGRLVTFIAGRFAAKEAVVKALGCGIGVAAFQYIEILPDEAGRPHCFLSAKARERLQLPHTAKEPCQHYP